MPSLPAHRARSAVVLFGLAAAACPSEPKLDPAAQAEGLYLAGTAAYLKGDFAEAHRRFDEVRALAPRDPRLPAATGELFLSEGNLAEALVQFDAAVLLTPGRATNWSRRGFILLMLGRRAEAATSLERALALNPADFNALEQLGELRAKEGDVDRAVAAFTAAARAAPQSAKAFLWLRAAGELSRRGRRDEARVLLGGAADAGTRTGELISELADLDVQAGQLAEAADLYREAARSSTDPTLWDLAGEAESKLGRTGEAEAAYRESLRVKNRAVVHVALARLCQARKDAECLLAELDRALATATGEEVRESIDLADLLASVGRKKDALALLAQVAEEPAEREDVPLQLKVAALAGKVGDARRKAEACARARSADAGVTRCP